MLLALLITGIVGFLYFYAQDRSGRTSRFAKHLGTSTRWSQLLHNPETKESDGKDQTDNGHQSASLIPPLDVVHTNMASSPSLPSLALTPTPIRIVVAMTGATGAALGVRLLQILRHTNIESHLVISKWAAATLAYETDYTVKDLRALAYKTYSTQDVAASISSGSFRTQGMIIVPCSMKTLSAVANGYGDDLITRAADVTLKERRKLVVVARETPLTGIHLHNMMTITNNGGIIFPPVPAFYTKPQSVDDIIAQSVGRILDLFDIDTGDFERWSGIH
jgi:4-hydroxy-3-polyprenylbenzoate decarboxylase